MSFFFQYAKIIKIKAYLQLLSSFYSKIDFYSSFMHFYSQKILYYTSLDNINIFLYLRTDICNQIK